LSGTELHSATDILLFFNAKAHSCRARSVGDLLSTQLHPQIISTRSAPSGYTVRLEVRVAPYRGRTILPMPTIRMRPCAMLKSSSSTHGMEPQPDGAAASVSRSAVIVGEGT